MRRRRAAGGRGRVLPPVSFYALALYMLLHVCAHAATH